MDEKLNLLNTRTKQMIATLEKGINWISINGDTSSLDSKKRLLNDNKRKLNRVSSALQKRPSIAIFGQSQVGKSFLVRSLAKSPITSKLEIINSMTEERIDFLQKINPPGGRESTGIITRFSTSKPINIKSAYAYKVELLSQLDIAAIIINGYLEDIQEYIEELDKEEILDKVTALKAAYPTIDNTDLKEDKVYDFNDYIISNYKDDRRIDYCKAINFFNDLVLLLPRMSYDKRWELLHFLWGKNKFLTTIFNRLSETLYHLGFAQIAYVNEKAIINGKKDPQYANTTNILDVERVKQMFYTPALEQLSVCNSNGELKNVPVSEFSALIKELHFEIPNDFDSAKERTFLLQTDVLDFPGSKSREKVPETVYNSNKESEKLSLYVRGKVSYLFYLYNRDIGISTLLYCMDNEPPLVSESPGLLDKWIKRYVGNNPDARKKHQETVLRLLQSQNIKCEVGHISPLLVAMTKFNVELSGKGGAEVLNDPDSHNSKWYARFKENFSNYMSKPVEDKWTENWTSENDFFKFIFPIRDPGFSGAFFQGYEPKHQHEEKIRPEKEEIIKDMQKSFMNSKIINDFIFDKHILWDELLTPNKTGIDYLCKYLAPSSHPINMHTQLENIFTESVNNSLKILKSEYSSGNMDEDLKVAKIKGTKAAISIISLSNSSNNSLSQYLTQVVISENEIWRMLYEFKFNVQDDDKEESIDFSRIKSFLTTLGINMNNDLEIVKQELIDYFGVEEKDLNEILKSQIGIDVSSLLSPNLKTKNVSELFADLVINYWSDKLTSLSFKNGAKFINENEEVVKTIFAEMLKSPVKESLKNQIVKVIENELSEGVKKEKFNLISSCCVRLKCICRLGWM